MKKLTALEALIVAKNPTLAKAFAKGASKSKLAALAKALGSAPVDLASLYEWHDGMRDTQSLGPEENWSLMSIDESIDAWRFLGKPSRFPFLTNGAGDYVGVETAKKGRGALHHHWHDNTKCGQFGKSLEAYVGRLISEYGALEPGTWKAVSVGKPAKWVKITRLPNVAQLAKRPIGTLFRFFEPKPTLNGPVKVLQLFAKVGESLWAGGAGRDEAAALVRINDVLPKPFSYGWPKNDDQVHFSLDFARGYHKVAVEESTASITARS